MNFHVMTLFPEMIEQGAQTSILGRAIKNGLISLQTVNIRDYTENKHKKVDDYPYGGGAGMLMQAQPVFDCYQAVTGMINGNNKQIPDTDSTALKESNIRVIYLTPQGKRFNQKMAEELSRESDLVFLCGHYEGIDERVLEEIVTDYVSIGDYVLTGGELPAMVMIDAVARLVPGVLHNEISADFETFHNDLLEYPQYSRPEEWHGRKVPEVLLSGNHRKVEEWRLEQSENRTKKQRPDLYEKYSRKQQIIKQLAKKDKILYIDMTESLLRGKGELIFDGEEGIVIRDDTSCVTMLMAFGESNAEKIVAMLPVEKGIWQYIVHQEYLLTPMQNRFTVEKIIPMRQQAYTNRVSLPEEGEVEFRVLTIEYLEEVVAHYNKISEPGYIKERLLNGCIVGAFIENRLAGFAGVHQEGSLGMLEVYEEYRRRGIGAALEVHMINLHLASGFTPYGQVIVDNVPSLELQKKLGLRISKGKLFWVIAKERMQ